MKFWHANRLDQEADHDPVDVAAKFLAAFRDGYEIPRQRGIEFALRWWISDPKEFNASWEESDFPVLLDALADAFEADPAVHEAITDAIYSVGVSTRKKVIG